MGARSTRGQTSPFPPFKKLWEDRKVLKLNEKKKLNLCVCVYLVNEMHSILPIKVNFNRHFFKAVP
jgi:hypothetical protein